MKRQTKIIRLADQERLSQNSGRCTYLCNKCGVLLSLANCSSPVKRAYRWRFHAYVSSGSKADASLKIRSYGV